MKTVYTSHLTFYINDIYTTVFDLNNKLVNVLLTKDLKFQN